MPSLPPSYRPLGSTPRPFPTRGVPGGWRDPWDDDRIDTALAALPRPAVHERSVQMAEEHIVLSARPREDGRWEAHVVSWDHPAPSRAATGRPTRGPALAWPSVNGPTATVALDALETELRELGGTVPLTAE